ncbi:MAG: hypothetical protein QHJ73_20210, partial [Armatimonadota bacterium]|nr:hypothetical protein [Armatimonadota bacterium]
MRRILLFVTLATLLPVCAARGEDTRLTYTVEALNAARPVTLVSPGANGSRFAIRLVVASTDWARWNLPGVDPNPECREVRFYVRAVGQPARVSCRVVEGDGSEWQSPPLEPGAEWREYRLDAAQFTHFRGGLSRRDTRVRLEQVWQIQFVVSGSPADAGIDVDDVALWPRGRRFTFEAEEQRPPLSPTAARLQRLGAVVAACEAERRRVAMVRDWARRCTADLQALLASRRPGEGYASFSARHARRT